LAAGLKELHEKSGLSGVELARLAGWSQSKVSRIENRLTKPSSDDVRTWAGHTGASEDETVALLNLADDLATIARTWRAVHREGLAAAQRRVAAYEERSTGVTNLETNVVPGLLQVPAYAERMLRGRDASTTHDVREAVAARMNRQAILFDPARTFTFVITEAVALYRPGGADVHAAQAHRLLEMEQLPNVTLGVLPFSSSGDWPVIPSDGWMVFHIPGEVTVLSEAGGGEHLTTDEQEVTTFLHRTEQALEMALTGDAARELIRSAVQ
jgi:transcriptional regulator with XRE-family HTH domain